MLIMNSLNFNSYNLNINFSHFIPKKMPINLFFPKFQFLYVEITIRGKPIVNYKKKKYKNPSHRKK